MNDKLHNVLLVLFIKHSDAVNINADNLNTFFRKSLTSKNGGGEGYWSVPLDRAHD